MKEAIMSNLTNIAVAFNFGYGIYGSSMDGTPLVGKHVVVGDMDNDDEGYEWRAFTVDQYETIKSMAPLDIFKKYPAAIVLE